MTKEELKHFLDEKVDYYNRPYFIENDPISIPHQFSKKQDIEISGLFAALFAWGQRTTIINKANDLMQRMDRAPYEFIRYHTDNDLKRLIGFKHRTLQDVDLLYLVDFLKRHYTKHKSLEEAFFINSTEANNLPKPKKKAKSASKEIHPAFSKTQSDSSCIQELRLRNFYDYVFDSDHLKRSEKHIATPAKKSACKRINMYLRWMVRQDKKGVDFGLWKKIKPSELIIPLDVHVCRVSKKLGLLKDTKTNWQIAVKLTNHLRRFDVADPVKYDFALFGMGVSEKE
jgi:uncharacterized protein (TIGR02757 family)